MIVEMQTITIRPKFAKVVEQRYQQALAARAKLSPLGGFFHTDVGTVNQIIMLWPYASLADRERVQNEAAALNDWPPQYGEYCDHEESTLLKPAPFSPPFEPRKLGNLYEFRNYTYRQGSIPTVIERWNDVIAARLKLSPLAGCWYSDTGPLNHWVHIWPYADAGARERIRAEAVQKCIWPPDTTEFMLKMENCLAFPASFSPLR
jgi:hypothetical protein